MHYLPTPEARMVIKATDALIIEIDFVPADSVSMGGYVIVEEV